MKNTLSASAATLQGFAAILLWSTTVALTRSISEQLGPLIAAAAVYFTSGSLGFFVLLRRGQWRPFFEQKARLYLFGCGSLFVTYMLFFFLAIGGAASREQVLEVGLLNYLWPVLTLLGTVAFLGAKARWFLIPATLFALAGIVLILTPALDGNLPLAQVFEAPAVYIFGTLAALSWAGYSVLARKWAGDLGHGAVAIFLCATAIVLFILAIFANEPRIWSSGAIGEIILLGTATYIAYEFWDIAMRKGNVAGVVAFSYLTPLFSTIFSCIYLAVMPAPSLWIGCVLLIIGSLLSWRSVL